MGPLTPSAALSTNLDTRPLVLAVSATMRKDVSGASLLGSLLTPMLSSKSLGEMTSLLLNFRFLAPKKCYRHFPTIRVAPRHFQGLGLLH